MLRAAGTFDFYHSFNTLKMKLIHLKLHYFWDKRNQFVKKILLTSKVTINLKPGDRKLSNPSRPLAIGNHYYKDKFLFRSLTYFTIIVANFNVPSGLIFVVL